ncbi:MAG: hypothetical protein LVS60_16230 [Nodosilinea sp. LVE1205-7]|jgi:hypothetical protein
MAPSWGRRSKITSQHRPAPTRLGQLLGQGDRFTRLPGGMDNPVIFLDNPMIFLSLQK